MSTLDSRRRSYLKIMASILSACHRWTKKTQVMGRCNLSSKQFVRYLDMLLGANLLLTKIDDRYFLIKVSDKGKYFLKAYNVMTFILEQHKSAPAEY